MFVLLDSHGVRLSSSASIFLLAAPTTTNVASALHSFLRLASVPRRVNATTFHSIVLTTTIAPLSPVLAMLVKLGAQPATSALISPPVVTLTLSVVSVLPSRQASVYVKPATLATAFLKLAQLSTTVLPDSVSVRPIKSSAQPQSPASTFLLAVRSMTVALAWQSIQTST